MRPSTPNANWSETSRDGKFVTWRCRGCRAHAVTAISQNAHPGKCLRCESRSGK
jgi:hypothetical protein